MRRRRSPRKRFERASGEDRPAVLSPELPHPPRPLALVAREIAQLLQGNRTADVRTKVGQDLGFHAEGLLSYPVEHIPAVGRIAVLIGPGEQIVIGADLVDADTKALGEFCDGLGIFLGQIA